MAKRRGTRTSARGRTSTSGIAATADELLLATLQAGGDPAKTGRFIVTFKQGATNAGTKSLKSRSGLRMASARDFTGQAVDFSALADADGLVFPEIGVALVTAQAMSRRGLSAQAIADGAGPVQSVDPEFFMFATDVDPAEYLRGFMAAAKAIAADLAAIDVVAQVAGVTWGLNACRVPMSAFNGTGIRVAVLDTGFDVGHPEFAGRSFVTSTFAGQPVQDLNGTERIPPARQRDPTLLPDRFSATASPSGVDLHRQGPDELRLRHAGAGAGRHELGDRQSLSGDFDVSRRANPCAAVLHRRWNRRAEQRLFDHRGCR
jgi:subtilisin family serine protease